MRFKERRSDARLDRLIITGMVVSTDFLRQLHPIFRRDSLVTPFAVTVAGWCMDFFRQFEKAPGNHIQDIFIQKEEEGLDVALADTISLFLQDISEEYDREKKFNSQYVFKEAEKLFRTRSLKKLRDDIDLMTDRGQIDEAEDLLRDYKRIEAPQARGIDIFSDREVWKRAFESRQEPLFNLPGAYGQLLTPHFKRSGFVGFLGRAKIGKTWRLWDIATWALRDRCNVAFFQAGDLTEDDMVVRVGVYMAKRSNDPRYCGVVRIPVLDCLNNQEGICERKSNRDRVIESDGTINYEDNKEYHKPCSFCRKKKDGKYRGSIWYELRPKVEPLEENEAWDATQKWKKRFRVKGFKLVTYSNNSLTVSEIGRNLDYWQEEEGFVPDVILVDYPDIMAKDDKNESGRDAENTRWKLLRKLSQDRCALVIVPTQSNRLGYERETLKITDMGEDQRKTHHTTAFFALNQTPKEEEKGLIRISSLGQAREGDLKQQVVVAQCLEIGRPYLGSYFLPKRCTEPGSTD